MYLGYLPVDSRRRVETPVIRAPFRGGVNSEEEKISVNAEGEEEGNESTTTKSTDTLTSMVESFYIESRDGTRLHSHFYKFPSDGRYALVKDTKWIKSKDKGKNAHNPNPSTPTILFFHGTSGNIGHRIGYAHTLSTICQCNVMLLNCRGYGLSDGHAHSKGIREDSQAGLEYLLTKRKDVDRENVFVLGQSMGGAIAIDLAMRNLGKIKGMIIDNTFTRIADLVPEVLPPFSHLRDYLTEDWDSLGAIERASGDKNFPHCLFLIGDKDELINSRNGKELYRAAAEAAEGSKGKEVRMLLFKYGFHVHTFKEPFYFDSISQFINEVINSRKQ